jgi:hypothetical protein
MRRWFIKKGMRLTNRTSEQVARCLRLVRVAQGVDSETHFAELRLDFAGYFLKVAALPRTKD